MKKVIIQEALLKSLLTLSSVIEARDPYTGGHTWRVGQYAKLLGKSYGLNSRQLFLLEVGAIVHDLGKVGVSETILRKPGPLAENETSVIHQHPVVGAEITQNHPLYDLLQYSIKEHHERYDGKGYPGRLDGDNITIWGKITAVADAFDAMTSERPYRKALSVETALGQIEEESGTRFDPHLVRLFLELGKSGVFSSIVLHAGETRSLLSCTSCGPVIVPRADIQDGETLQCPVCTGRYTVHRKGPGFEMEFTGKTSGLYVPRADEEFIRTTLSTSRKFFNAK